MSTTQPQSAIHGLLEQIRQRHSALNPAPAQPSHPVSSPALAAYLHGQNVFPEVAAELVESVSELSAEPSSIESQLGCLEVVLRNKWRSSPSPAKPGETHIFVGPHGSGKTTVLSKWLAQTVLLGEQTARVFRLDAACANTAECLSVYGEVLGVPVLRSLHTAQTLEPVDVTFIDLPGLNIEDQAAFQELSSQIAGIARNSATAGSCPQIHLVLNAAYETTLLLAQIHAFSGISITDIIPSHLDEERRWGKLINLLWKTDSALGWLAAGQNVPGGLLEARPRHLLPRYTTNKTPVSMISQAA